MTERHDDDSRDERDSFDAILAQVARIPVRAEWTPPSELDEYKLVRPLGRGGMGSVWLAEDRLLDRQVAIKFVAEADLDPAMRERFEIEARAAARLTHANVVTVHRFGEIAGRPYLVSEYIRGDSLDALPKPIPWETALRHGLALSRGLAAAHRAGIVHRDIKPANAILTTEGEAKLVDFGLAKVAGRDLPGTSASGGDPSSALSTPGAIAGTPRYLAPEVRGGAAATRASDVYQLGAVLYELVIGRAPLLDQAELRAEVPSLAGRCGSPRFAEVVDRCLAQDPSQRFGSGDELQAALEQVASPVALAEVPAGNPYRGLAAFAAEHRGLFFGRSTEVRAVVERLRAHPLIVVVGDSGVGKSSLCRAGVLPQIVDGAFGDGLRWRAIELVPGQRPLTQLAAAIALHIGADEAELAAKLRDEPIALAREVRRACGPGQGLVVLIDQLEELVTLAEPDEAEAFAAVLDHLVAPAVRVLATVRSDFLGRVAGILGEHLAQALVLLQPLTAEGARAAVLGPARATGVRFESDALVGELVELTDELPLLAFTLAQLWEARDPRTQTIGGAALTAIGGVRGALARHADGVLAALLPSQQAAARALLVRLVTPERTRRRCTDAEIRDPAALAALIQGRLVATRGGDPPTYELAHERLIDGWPALAGWLSRATEVHAAHARLTAAVSEWIRLDRSRDALWSDRQLDEVAQVEDLSPAELAFVAASRQVQRRRRYVWRGIAITVPLVALGFYVGARVVAQRDLAHRVDGVLAAADRELETARAIDATAIAQRSLALRQFDAADAADATAEATWEAARRALLDAGGRYATIARELEAAMLLDRSRGDVRALLTAVTEARLALADHQYQTDDRSELVTRLALYDRASAEHLTAPARLTVTVEPATAALTVLDGDRPHPLDAPFAPGTYVVVATAPGLATVRTPIALAAGALAPLHVTLPPAASVPTGFIYVPRGSVLYGSRDDEAVRHFLTTVPMHELELPAYLIGRTEVTYAQWIEYLDAQAPDERERRTPRVETSPTVANGGLALRRHDGAWELTMTPATVTFTARSGQPIHYRDRTHGADQDWLQMPVSGISPDDAVAFAGWLDRTGRVPHARVCREAEWERAARGVDGRPYPNGDWLGDANIDVTYGRLPGAFGPDQVGTHPASASPFGLLDTAGNVWEIARSADGGYQSRGGCFYVDGRTAHLANRNYLPHDFRHILIGLRLCADVPESVR